MANFSPRGRRNNRLGTPKTELVDVVAALSSLGLGTTTIARILGYDQSRIYQIRNEFGIAGVGRESHGVLQFICDHLPPDLQAQCLRVRTRSEVAKTAIANKRGHVEARVVHHLLDAEDDTRVNADGETLHAHTKRADQKAAA